MIPAEHLLFALAVQGVGVCVARMLGRGQPRLIVWVCILSMLSFAVPWSYLGAGVSQLTNTTAVARSGAALVAEVAPAVSGSLAAVSVWQPIAIGVWLLVGAAWLAATFLRARLTLRRWRGVAQPGHGLEALAHGEYRRLLDRVEIYLLPASCFAVTSGLRRPTIWIGAEIATRPQLRAALNHELAHVRSRDPALVVLLTLLERAFWWNPLTWLLGAEARRQLEYDCDRRCKHLLGEREYQRSLAELSLLRAGVPALPSAPALQSRKGVIARMRRMSLGYATRPAHIALLAAFVGASVFASTVLAVDAEGAQPTIVECEREVPDHARWRMSIDRDPDAGTLSVTLTDLEQPDSRAVPEGAGPYVRCLFRVLGIPSEALPAGT